MEQDERLAACRCGKTPVLVPSFDRETGRVNGWSVKCECGISFSVKNKMKTIRQWNEMRYSEVIKLQQGESILALTFEDDGEHIEQDQRFFETVGEAISFRREFEKNRPKTKYRSYSVNFYAVRHILL